MGNRWPGVATVERQLLLEGSAGQREKRRIPIDDMQRLIHDRAGLNLARPGSEGADPCAAFVESAFSFAPWAVRWSLDDG